MANVHLGVGVPGGNGEVGESLHVQRFGKSWRKLVFNPMHCRRIVDARLGAVVHVAEAQQGSRVVHNQAPEARFGNAALPEDSHPPPEQLGFGRDPGIKSICREYTAVIPKCLDHRGHPPRREGMAQGHHLQAGELDVGAHVRGRPHRLRGRPHDGRRGM